MPRGPGVTITEDNLPSFIEATDELTGQEVMVGFPGVGVQKQGVAPLGADTRKESGEMNNATLGYIHEHDIDTFADNPAFFLTLLRPGQCKNHQNKTNRP